MPGCIVSTTTASFRSVEKRRRRALTPVMTSTFENVSDIGVCLGLSLGPPAKAGVRSKQGAVHLSISTEARENAQHVAATATAAYQQAVADRSTASLNVERTVVRAPVNGFVTNLTLVTWQYAAVGTKLIALIDSDSY